MKFIRFSLPFPTAIRALFLVACLSAARSNAAQTTWNGGTNGNIFGAAVNWSGGSIPGATDELIFTGPNTNTNVGFSTLPATVGALTFSGSYPHYFLNGNNGILTLNGVSGTGISVADTSSGGFGTVDINSGLNISLGANQTWATNGNLVMSGNLSGGNVLTKTGAGYLALNGSTSSFTGSITVSQGSLYLSQDTSSSGTLTLTANTKLGLGNSASDVTVKNAVALSGGVTLGGRPNGSGGGHIEFSGAVTLQSGAPTITLGDVDASFVGALNSNTANTALTFSSNGLGIAILGAPVTNIDSMVAANAAIGFGDLASLPAGSINATGGGYVSIGNVGLNTPTNAQLMAKITPAIFNGVIGFDTSEDLNVPTTFHDNIDLRTSLGFVDGHAKIGSATMAILDGTITPPAQTYDFGGYAGQGGVLLLKTNLTELNSTPTNISVSTPVVAGASPDDQLSVVLSGGATGTSDLSGTVSVTNARFIFDQPTTFVGSFTLNAAGYIGYTESSSFGSFTNFLSHVNPSNTTATSILGLDNHNIIGALVAGTDPSLVATRTVTDAIDLSGFTSIVLGSLTGAVAVTGTITAPSDHVLRLTQVGDAAAFRVSSNLLSGNVDSVVAGTPGSGGAVILAGTNTYTGGTTLQSGGLLVSNGSAVGSGDITVTATTGDMKTLGASSGTVTLTNNLKVTDNLRIGTGGDVSDGDYAAGGATLVLGGSGVISDTTGNHGRLYVTGPTTLSGHNTYSGGTYILADTTVTTNDGLGTGFVDLGYKDRQASTKAILTFTASAPSIGTLANAGGFLNNGGTGDIHLPDNATSLTVNQTSNLPFSGQITGTTGPTAAALIKTGGAQLTLTGNNAGQFTGGTTISAGALSIGDGQTTGVTFGGNVAVSVTGSNTGLFFKPASGQTISYNGSISGSGAVTMSGGVGILDVTGGSSTFTGATTINNGTLRISADNAWSSSSATNLSSPAGAGALNVNANQTLLNLVSGTNSGITIASAKTLTVNNTSSTTLQGVISGTGGMLEKTGGSTLTLTGANTYDGGTKITAGTLSIGAGTATGSVAGSIDVASGATLQINLSGSTTISNTITGAGTLRNQTGTTTLSGTNTYSGGTVINNSTVVVSSNANLGNASGGITFSGGSPTLRTSAALGTVARAVTMSSSGTIDTNGFNTTWSGAFSGGNSLTKSGAGVLTVTSSNPSFSGATFITGGTLIMNGSFATSNVTINSGGTLGGSGTVGGVTLSSGGFLAPGNSPGVLTTGNLSLLGTTMMELGGFTRGTDYDGINAANITFGGTLSVSLIGGFNPTLGSSFDLFDWTGTKSGTFSSTSLPSLGGGLGWDTSNLYTTGTITVSAIPEPSTYAAIAAVMMLGFAVWRRRAARVV